MRPQAQSRVFRPKRFAPCLRLALATAYRHPQLAVGLYRKGDSVNQPAVAAGEVHHARQFNLDD